MYYCDAVRLYLSFSVLCWGLWANSDLAESLVVGGTVGGLSAANVHWCSVSIERDSPLPPIGSTSPPPQSSSDVLM